MNRDERTRQEIVERATCALREKPIPDGPPREVLTAALAAGETAENKPRTFASWQRRFAMSRIAKIAAAVVLLAGIVGLVAWLTVGSGGGTIAFAQVREQIQQAHTMTFKMTLIIPLMGERKTMAMECSYKEPGLMRQVVNIEGEEGPITNIINLEQARALALVAKQKVAVLVDLGKLPEEARSEYKDYAEQLKKMVEGSDEPLGEKEIDGLKAKGFRVTHQGQTMDIWVDATTGHPVLMEANLPGGISMTMRDFAFDVELDDSLFSLTPPADYEVREFQMDLTNLSEDDLIEGLRFLAEHNDNVFPPQPTVTPEIVKNYQKELMKQPGLSKEEKTQLRMDLAKKIARIAVFIQKKAGPTWRYVGDGVRFGDKDTPVCWYRPKDSETYRLIYGDLSVKDVAEADLPTAPAAEQTPEGRH